MLWGSGSRSLTPYFSAVLFLCTTICLTNLENQTVSPPSNTPRTLGSDGEARNKEVPAYQGSPCLPQKGGSQSTPRSAQSRPTDNLKHSCAFSQPPAGWHPRAEARMPLLTDAPAPSCAPSPSYAPAPVPHRRPIAADAGLAFVKTHHRDSVSPLL